MKKLLLITGAVLIAYLLLMTAAPGSGAHEIAAADSASIASDTGYIVTAEQGRIVVYQGAELYLSTDTPVASLPKADRTKLERGIYVYSQKELKPLLEDLCS